MTTNQTQQVYRATDAWDDDLPAERRSKEALDATGGWSVGLGLHVFLAMLVDSLELVDDPYKTPAFALLRQGAEGLLGRTWDGASMHWVAGRLELTVELGGTGVVVSGRYRGDDVQGVFQPGSPELGYWLPTQGRRCIVAGKVALVAVD